MTSDTQMKNNMDRMYRFTRHVYDASRKYYLLGRDQLIQHLNAKPNENVIEIGCGTARNLIKMAKRYPDTKFYGIDISDEMLKTARKSVEKSRLSNQISLSQGYAQNFKPAADHIHKMVFSYSLSIIPPWKESVDHALSILPSGSEIHVVDFGGQEKLPAFFRAFVFWWLKLFHVYHKPEVLEYFKKLEQQDAGSLEIEHLYGGYAYRLVFRKA